MLSVIRPNAVFVMLSVILLSVIILIVTMLNVVAPMSKLAVKPQNEHKYIQTTFLLFNQILNLKIPQTNMNIL
jgi:hypothetical protein